MKMFVSWSHQAEKRIAAMKLRLLTAIQRQRIAIDRLRGRYPAVPFLAKYPRASDKDQKNLGPLERIYYEHDGQETTKWHHYFQIYEAEIGAFTGRPVRLLEIGVLRGGSLQIWRKYLGEQAIIFGIDSDASCKKFETGDLQVRIGSQGDSGFLRKVVTEMGGVDVVIDDGSHIGVDQIASFKALFPLLALGGVYIVEDVHAAYWREYLGGVDRAGTIVTFAKGLIDDLNGWYHDHPPRSLPGAREQIGRITFYDSIIAITKVAREPPQPVFVGADPDKLLLPKPSDV